MAVEKKPLTRETDKRVIQDALRKSPGLKITKGQKRTIIKRSKR